MNVVAQRVTLPAGAVIAYESKDGVLHKNEIDRDIADAEAEVKANLSTLSRAMIDSAPYSHELRENAATSEHEIARLLEEFADSAFFNIWMESRQRVAALRAKKNVMKSEKTGDKNSE
jgi:antibiotic biosynthesis monooxygenase (ABM) superfamily enzyme